MFNTRYHLIAEGKDADCLRALMAMEDTGLEYILTLVDKCPDYFYHLKSQHTVDKLPLVFKYEDSSFSSFKFIGGLQDFLEHVEELFK